MDKKVKPSWPLFVFGFIGVATLLFVFQETGISKEDNRIKRLEDKDISGLKAKPPMSKEMVAQLKRKEEDLAAKELELKEYEELLKLEEQRIQSKIDRLVEVQGALDAKEAAKKKIAKETKESLVKTFEKMQPKKSAAVIETMEDDLAVELLKEMKEKSVAAVLENMPPDRAVTLSTLIAGRSPAADEDDKGQPSPMKGGSR